MVVEPYLVGGDEGSRSLTINDNGTEHNVRKRTRQPACNSPPGKTVWGHDCVTQDKLCLARHSTSARKKSRETPNPYKWMHARHKVHLEIREKVDIPTRPFK